MSQDRISSFQLTLQKNHGGEAARQALALAAREDWELLVEFALAVVLLQEGVATSVEYWVAPRAR